MTFDPTPLDRLRPLRGRRLDSFALHTIWGATGSPLGGMAEAWHLTGRIGVPDDDIGVATVKAEGVALRPRMFGWLKAASVARVYGAAPAGDALFQKLYETRVEADGRLDEGLRAEVLELIDAADPDLPRIPDLHIHVSAVRFRDGFSSKTDLAAVLDHLAERFAAPFVPGTALMTLDGNAVEHLGISSGHELLKALPLLGEIGFELIEDLFVLKSSFRVATQRRRRLVERPTRLRRRGL